jgi:MFS family permease
MAASYSRLDGAPEAAPRRGVFALIAIGVWLHAADTLVTATLAPSIIARLGGVAYINWTIALYEVGAIVAGAASGALCVRFGLKRLFIAGASLYGMGCIAAAAAPSMSILLLGRLVQGLGGGMMLSLCYLAIQTWYPEAERRRLYGIVAAIWGVGSLLGPLIGGIFAGPHTWRGAFGLFALQALLLCGLSIGWLPQTRAVAASKQWPVLPLLVLTSATLLIAQAGVSRSPAATLTGLFAGSALLYVAARIDRRATTRLLPMQTLDIRHPLGAGLLMVFALSVGTTGFWAYGPLIVTLLFATKPLTVGYILAGEAFAWSLATLAITKLPGRYETTLIRAGALGTASGAAGFALTVPAGSLFGMILCALLQGAGFGLCWPAILARTTRFADPGDETLASAAVPNVQRIGYAVGTAAAGIAANLSGLIDGVSVAAAKAAGFWVFAAFLPVLMVAVASAWRFTREGLN